MKRQTILWTVVPNGLTDDGLRLRASLVASPRLETDEAPYRLGQFPDWLDWPARVAGGTFALDFQGGPIAPATVVSAPSSAAWQALFGANTPLEPYVFEGLRDRAIHSYPVGHVADWIAAFYGQIYDLSPEDFPHPGRVEQPLGQLGSVNHRGVAAQLRSYLANPEQRAVPPGPPDVIADFAQAALFHAAPPAIVDPVAAADGASGPLRTLAVDPPELDFHAAVSALGSYPTLQRLFGIVVDVEVEFFAIPVGPAQAVRAVVTMDLSPAIPGAISVAQTRYDMDLEGVGDRFEAASKLSTPQVRDGLLDLAPGDGQIHRVVQTDTDGGALKLIQLADNLRRIAQRQDTFLRDRTADTGALPSVPDGGLAVVRTGRAFALARRIDGLSLLQAALVTDPNAPETLYREDLVQGFRLDVFDMTTARWASLCARRGPWRIVDTGDAVLQSGELDDEGFVETGVTSKPEGGSPDLYAHEALMRWAGWSLVAPRPGEAILPDDGVGNPDEATDPDFRLHTDLAVTPGTLPSLRYGRRYRLRVRAVDLAGNGRPLGDPNDADPKGASDPVPYWRHQPVPYPAIAPRALPADALGEANETLVVRSAAGVLATDYAALEGLPPSDERHVIAPRATVELIERHGRLDGPSGSSDPAAYALLAARDQGLATVTGAVSGGPGGAILAIPGTTFDLPYLPDPLAIGACFRGLPGVAPGEAFTVLYPPGPGGTWADRRPIRLRVEEDLSGTLAAPQLPQWDPTTGILSAYLPKSLVARVWVSSILAPGAEELFAVWQWFVAHKGGAVPEALRTAARLGKHWLLTPPRRLALVHAVPKPLEMPVISGLVAPRTTIGQTDAALAGAVALHGHSTGRLDVNAAWTEPYDNPAAPAPTTREGKAPVGELDVAPSDTSLPLAGMRHRFGDTKHRLVDYTAVATTRFKEFFPAALTADPADITLASAIATADVPSSARPIAPDVRYVVPTFRWSDTPTSRTRRPGLRVYLGRPWYGSGEGELLAVVLEDRELPIALPGATPAPFEVSTTLAPFATQWAVDPIWNAASPGTIGPARFPNRVATKDELTIEELRKPDGTYAAGDRVIAVGFPVAFDADRRLWFADIDVEAEDGYWPFIRLALARFQPSSVANAHLSRVVLADFAQISPERVASITDLTGNRYRVAISGAHALASSDIQPPKAAYAIRLEQRPIAAPDAGEDVETWTPVGSVAVSQQRDGFAGEFVTRGDASMRYRLVIEEREQFPFTEPRGRDDETPERTVYLGILDVPFVPIPTPTPSQTSSPTDALPAAAAATPTWTPAPSRTAAPTETASPGPTGTTGPATRTPTPGTPGTPGEETATPGTPGTPGTPPATATDDGEGDDNAVYVPFTRKP